LFVLNDVRGGRVDNWNGKGSAGFRCVAL